MGIVYKSLVESSERRGGGFFLLLDPDHGGLKQCVKLAESAEECGVDALLVGSSFMFGADFHESIKQIKKVTDLKVIVFPGSFAQVSPYADAILFTSLISGRNPNYLIEEQVKGAPLVHRFGLETIPTGYMLIESGPLTSVQYMSGTLPIPRHKYDIACAHALAAQYMGMKAVYLEAGSGAVEPVPIEMVAEVADLIDIPIITGGGLKSPEDCAARIEAGATFVVMGNSFENDPGQSLLCEVTEAVHRSETITV